MNLRKSENYNVGLDIGTGSVGWCAADETGKLYKFNGKTTWGSRIFPSADTAANTRIARGQRRRYDRRRQRLNLLQQLFAIEMEKVDPEFFIRLNQARLLQEDRDESHTDYRWPLFNDSDFTERDYYAKYPTIYHLRAALVESSEKADIRLIYLAFHNIVKCRGNFLYQDSPSLSAKNANMQASVERLCDALNQWGEEMDVEVSPIANKIEALFAERRSADLKKELAKQFGLPKEYSKMATALASLLLGYKAELANIFGGEPNESNVYLKDDEKVDAYRSMLDKNTELFDAMLAVYSSYVLSGILSDGIGETISFCKIHEYDRYANELKTLKQLVREYRPECYNEFFRGDTYEGTDIYKKGSVKGYTAYNLRGNQEDFFKEARKLFKGSAAEQDKRYITIQKAMDEGIFLRRLKTSDNGVIPYQLHLEEMDAIIKNQSYWYPFLKENCDKIRSLVTFRIPYYVGPLTQKNARLGENGKPRFAWSVRQEGKETEKIYPWNWDEVIDRDQSAKAFMDRMIGTCTYLNGEQVLPRRSIMYETFCVLNEINGAKWTADGDSFNRFDAPTREAMVEELFKKQASVGYKRVASWMKRRGFFGQVKVVGGQGETGFESKMSSYRDFCSLLKKEQLSNSDIEMAEELILWNTLFEDRDILKRKIHQKYGDILSENQIEGFCRKRYTGWGRLSRKLLCEVKMETDCGLMSVIDILKEGNPNNSRRTGRAMNFMEILHDNTFELQKKIDCINAERAKSAGGFSLDNLQGSPALRRSVNQTLRVVEEIIGIAGKPPANIFVEVTRDENARKKGQRTTKRYEAIKAALAVHKEENRGLIDELNNHKEAINDERLALYFMQRGKSLYSGKALDINLLHTYHIDHIIPQSYIKDDSLNNKALVLQSENERKLDSLLLDSSVIRKMRGYWRELLDAGLITRRKYDNLTCTNIDGRIKGFIARQLVETSQIVKFVQQVLNEKYPDTAVIPVKAALSSGLRRACGFVKCREINDYHHAHDAYLACEIGRFIQYRHGKFLDDPVAMNHVVKNFIKKQGEKFAKTRKMPGDSGFFIGSFLTSGFDKETGEIRQDEWDAEAEVNLIRKQLNYKDCFISRMPEETTGAFWDATIYSPRDEKKKLELPLKKGLDPKKYGSYSREQFAYFFVYEAEDKKGRIAVRFEPVPVSVASLITQRPYALEEFAEKSAASQSMKFIKILKRKVYKYQLISIDGDRLYVTGLREVRNATQIALGQKDTLKFASLDSEICHEDQDTLFEIFTQALCKNSKRLSKSLSLDTLALNYSNVSQETRSAILKSVASIASAKTNMIDLSEIGGAKHSGCLNVSFSKLLSSGDVEFIHQSVTGMFERRYRLEL